MEIDASTFSIFGSATEPTAHPKQSASDFESLLIAQLLRAARPESEGWLGTGEDTTINSLMEMAEDQIAKAIAQGGGFGIATLIEKSLAQAPESSTEQISGRLR
jgi:Rod binding domain-containing protein